MFRRCRPQTAQRWYVTWRAVVLLTGALFGWLGLFDIPWAQLPEVSLIASATGSSIPQPVNADEYGALQNGAFLITPASTDPLVGDGIEDRTFWPFDFRAAPDIAVFPTSARLAAAQLTLQLVPTENNGEPQDMVYIETFLPIPVPIPQERALSRSVFVQIDLLSFYQSDAILRELMYPPQGQLTMIYEANEIVASAHLHLVSEACATVPELERVEVNFVVDDNGDEVNELILHGKFDGLVQRCGSL